MTRNKKIGLAFLLSPWIGFLLTYTLFFTSRALMNSEMQTQMYLLPQTTSTVLTSQTSSLQDTNDFVLTSENSKLRAFDILRAISGLLGTLSVILIFVGTGIGIYYMSKAEKQVDTKK